MSVPFLDELRAWHEDYVRRGERRGVRVDFTEGTADSPKRAAWIVAYAKSAEGQLTLWESGECDTEARGTAATDEPVPLLLRSRVLGDPASCESSPTTSSTTSPTTQAPSVWGHSRTLAQTEGQSSGTQPTMSAMPTIIGQVIVSYRGSSWSKTNIGWPFGLAEFSDDRITLSARWPKRFFRPTTLRRDEITKIEPDGRLTQRFGHGWTFHTALDAERFTFYAYGRKNVAELDRVVEAFKNRQPLG